MKKLKSAFKDAFGVPIEQILPLEKNLIPIEGNPDDAILFGSKSAAENPNLLDPRMASQTMSRYTQFPTNGKLHGKNFLGVEYGINFKTINIKSQCDDCLQCRT